MHFGDYDKHIFANSCHLIQCDFLFNSLLDCYVKKSANMKMPCIKYQPRTHRHTQRIYFCSHAVASMIQLKSFVSREMKKQVEREDLFFLSLSHDPVLLRIVSKLDISFSFR